MPITSLHDQVAMNTDDWRMLRDFDNGERHVKAAGIRYLPKLSDQDDDEYDHYKDRGTFVNAVRRTVDGLVNLAFHRPLEVDLGSAEALRPLLETFTEDGQPFKLMAQESLRETLLTGRYGGLVDATKDGKRIYGVGYKTEHITNWLHEYAYGVKQPTTIVLREFKATRGHDGYGVDHSELWRELALQQDANGEPEYHQYIHNPDPKDQSSFPSHLREQARPSISGVPFRQIPFVFFGSESLSPEVQRSPILDIAYLNLHHYRFYTDLNWGRHWVSLPTPVISGAPVGGDDTIEFSIGPSNVWMLDMDSKAEMLEFKGSGLQYLERALSLTEKQMAMLGARLVGMHGLSGGGSEAEEVARMRERVEHATLWTVIDTVERGLEKMLRVWVEWHKQDSSGVKVTFNRDFKDDPIEHRMALVLMRAHRAGLLPRDAVIQALVEGDVLPSTLTAADVRRAMEDPAQMVPEEEAKDAKV